MKFTAAPGRSRLARRVVTLLVLCALLPTVTLTWLSVLQVQQLLEDIAVRQMARDSKLLGDTLVERLQLAAAELRLGEGLRTSSTRATSSRLGALSSVAVRERSSAPVARSVPSLRTSQGVAGVQVTLVGPPDAAGMARAASVEPGFLWDLDVDQSHSVCIRDADQTPLHCDASLPLAAEQALARTSGPSGELRWTHDGVLYLGHFRDISLGQSFSAPSWRLVLSVRRDALLAPLRTLGSVVAGAVALALVLVALLGLSLVRRYTAPLARLLSGTRALASGDFAARMEVDGEDELAELAESFNTMSSHIGRQLRTLETMSTLDRLILSSTDPDRIVDALLEGIPALVDCNGVMLARVSDSEGKMIHVQARATGGYELDVELMPEQIAWHEFEHADGALTIEPLGVHALMLRGMPDHAPVHWLGLPVRMNDALVAVVGVGLADTRQLDETRLKNLGQLADRVAVALSNVAWEQRLYHQAHYDALTDLPNRALLQDRLAQAMERCRRDSTMAAVLFLDLDRFKSVNDLLGHAAGDRLLVDVARRLEEAVRSVDTVVRFGGDEFVVITPDLPGDDWLMSRVSRIAESLLAVFEAGFVIDGRRFEVGASIGISVYPRDASSISEAMSNADAAMYHAKSLGRSRYQFYSNELNTAASVQTELAGDLRRAMDDGELVVHYQPKLDPQTTRLMGAECLVRWRHPRMGIIEPMTLLPVADDAGLTEELGAWVIRSACAQLRAWADQGHRTLSLSVNLSVREFRDPAVVDTVRKAVCRAGIDPSRLALEVAEPLLVRDPDQARTTLTRLAELGVRIFIDDFGTAHSSVAQLTAFPVHGVKMHGPMVRDAVDRTQVGAVVAALAGLASSLSLRLVATGVETLEQSELVREMRFDECQGHFYGMPSSIEELDRRLRPATTMRLVAGTEVSSASIGS